MDLRLSEGWIHSLGSSRRRPTLAPGLAVMHGPWARRAVLTVGWIFSVDHLRHNRGFGMALPGSTGGEAQI